MSPHREIRPSAVSGMFYSADPGALRNELAALYSRSRPERQLGAVAGVIVPHAGYAYSGLTAARAYSHLAGSSYGTVVLLAPSHRDFFDGISVFPGDAYETPLGPVTIDAGFRNALMEACPQVSPSRKGHTAEHAIEVQLPFLQYLLPEFQMVPLVIGHQTRETCMTLGECLAKVLKGAPALLVASSDLSHYHTSAVAERLDRTVAEAVSEFDADRLMDIIESGVAEACGGGPMVAAMVALRRLGVHHIAIVHRSTSADVTGDHKNVVGYLSAVAYN